MFPHTFELFNTSLNTSNISSFVSGGNVCKGGGVVTSFGIVSILCTEEGSPRAMISCGRPGLQEGKRKVSGKV